MIEELIIVDRKIANINSDIEFYKKQNKRIKLFFAKRKQKKLKKQYKNIKNKLESTIFYKK